MIITWRHSLYATVYCVAIFILSSGPVPIEGPSFPAKDKIAHVAIYAGLAAIVGAGIRRKGRSSPAFEIMFPILFATLYGVTDEIHQSFVPTRSCDLLDVAADFTGAVLVQIAWYGIFRRGRSITSKQSTNP